MCRDITWCRRESATTSFAAAGSSDPSSPAIRAAAQIRAATGLASASTASTRV